MRLLGALMAVVAGLASGEANVTKDMGSAKAAITVDLYSDFQCPHCKLVHETWMPAFLKDYVRTGRVHLIQHEFPLTQHPFARTAATYAVAADRIGKYGEVSDVLFQKQDQWGKSGKVDETVAGVLSPADFAKVRALSKDPAVIQQMENDIAMGIKIPLTQTPTVIVMHKGRHYNVNVEASYSLFAQLLDSLR